MARKRRFRGGQSGEDDAEIRRRMAEAKAKAAASESTQSPVTRTTRFGTKTRIGAGLLAGAGLVGTGYAIHRHRQSKEPAVKSLVNPFEEVIVFGKAYPVVEPVPRSTRLRALVPTGGHIGHALDLGVFRGGGPKITRTQLQRYSKADSCLPFAKAWGHGGKTVGEKLLRHTVGIDQTTKAGNKARQVSRGVLQVKYQPKPTRVPGNRPSQYARGEHPTNVTEKLADNAAKARSFQSLRRAIPNSKIPAGAGRGSRIG